MYNPNKIMRKHTQNVELCMTQKSALFKKNKNNNKQTNKKTHIKRRAHLRD